MTAKQRAAALRNLKKARAKWRRMSKRQRAARVPNKKRRRR